MDHFWKMLFTILIPAHPVLTCVYAVILLIIIALLIYTYKKPTNAKWIIMYVITGLATAAAAWTCHATAGGFDFDSVISLFAAFLYGTMFLATHIAKRVGEVRSSMKAKPPAEE